MFRVDITGGRELALALQKLGQAKAVKRAQLKGLGAGARVIRTEARRLAPKRTGRLRKSIKTKRRRGTRTELRYTVGIDGNIGQHAWLVEHGSGPRAHKNGGSTGIMPAQPFMAPAFENTKEKVVEDMMRRTKEATMQEARKAKIV